MELEKIWFWVVEGKVPPHWFPRLWCVAGGNRPARWYPSPSDSVLSPKLRKLLVRLANGVVRDSEVADAYNAAYVLRKHGVPIRRIAGGYEIPSDGGDAE